LTGCFGVTVDWLRWDGEEIRDPDERLGSTWDLPMRKPADLLHRPRDG